MPVRKMYTRPSYQIFTWAGDEPLQVGFGGQILFVPPIHETARTGGVSIYRFESARDAKGELMPGTLLVKDIDAPSGAGGRTLVFRVTEFCDYLARERDDLFGRGFNIVGAPNEVSEALEMGRPLYEASLDKQAREILANEIERRKKHEAKGEPAPPREDEHRVIWAIKHLKGREQAKPKTTMDEIRAALDPDYRPVQKPEAVVPARVTTATEIYEQAVELGVGLSKTELAGLLGHDPEQTAFVMEKIRLKREAAQAPA